ncbi:MAG: nucleoside hydrolase [Pseudomonadales bacterium]|jgi:pyrimidine-specific ribonucleoside hydrolase|nr:nucleoside hydrolase [Pseudomonadales bacterium]
MERPRPLIIDTDPALGVIHDGRPRDVDDAFAIVEALRAPELDVRAITVTFGNAPLEAATVVAETLVARAGVAVPVAQGQAAALPDSGLPPRTAAVDLLHATLGTTRCRIAALGPLGNLGALLLHHPEDAHAIEEVVIVGGRSRNHAFYLGEVGPVRDFNFENDVRAARILLESGVPVTCAGFELSSPVAMTSDHLDAIAAQGTELGRWLVDGARPWLEHWVRNFPADAGFHPWDSAAICWLRSPELIAQEARGWRIRDVEIRPSPGNPDQSPQRVPWLETDPSFEGRLTFLRGFHADADARFLETLVASCR